MIKFTTTKGSEKKLIGLGLSHANLDRLRAGHPIFVDGDSMNIEDFDILIFTGSTEEAMVKELAPNITANTIIHKTSTPKP